MINILGFPGGSVVKNLPAKCWRYKRPRFNPWVGKIPLEKEMATHSSILAWRIPWTENSLVGYSPRSHKELDTTELLSRHTPVQGLMRSPAAQGVIKNEVGCSGTIQQNISIFSVWWKQPLATCRDWNMTRNMKYTWNMTSVTESLNFKFY